MLLNELGWSEFKPVFNLYLLESSDNENEQFFINTPGEIDESLKKRLMKAGRFIERLYLSEIPFLLIFSDVSVDCVSIGWGVHLPHIEDWESVLKSERQGIVFGNMMTYSLLQGELEGDSVYSLAPEKIEKIHNEHNLHVYFLEM